MKNYLKKFFLLVFIAFTTFISVSFTTPASAQETPEETANKYGVVFPITELGGCSNIGECRTYCEDPLHREACIAFAKSKGFYKEDKLSERQQQLLNTAKTELGCADISSCQTLCHQEENFEKCNNYAKKHGLGGGHVEDPAKQVIVKKAQEILGCNSPQSCRSFCEQPENREKCDNFAKQVGLRGGENRYGPGGCTSEETCKNFCSDPNNFQVCQGFSQGSGGKFVGPGGCNSEASCRDYCQKNPQECGYGGPRPTGSYNPQEMCLRTPSCRWSNNTCECGFYNALESGKKAQEYTQFCREHPEQCQPGQLGGFVSSGDRQQFEQYCRENPEKCRMQFEQTPYPSRPYPSGPYPTWPDDKNLTPQPNYSPHPTYSFNPAEECQKNSNCRWENNTCQCTSSGTNPSPDPAQACQSQSGCRWEDNTCKCENSGGTSGGGTSGTSGESPEQMCSKTAGCTWQDNTCTCQQVQGAISPQNFLESFILFFSSLLK